jgi:tellurite resistance protein TerC
MRLFHYLHLGLSSILVFIGAKMLLADIYRIPIVVALSVVAGILVISVVASLLRLRKGDVSMTTFNKH